MEKKSKFNISIILIIISTVILAGVAVFTAIKLYTTRDESISMISPESQPEAYMLGPKQFKCQKGNDKIFQFRVGPFDETQCGISGFHDASDGCPQCSVQNQLSKYSSTFSVSIDSKSMPSNYNGEIKVNYLKATNWCPEPCGHVGSDNLCGVCHQNQKENTGQLVLNPGNKYSGTITVERGSDNGQACGSFQTDLTITSIEGVDKCDMTFPKPVIAGLCHTGIDCDNEYSNLSCKTISFSLDSQPTETTFESPTATQSETSTLSPTATSTTTQTESPTTTQSVTSSVTQTVTPTGGGGVGGESDQTTATVTKSITKSGETLPDAGFAIPTLFSGMLSLLLISLALILAI